MDLSLKLLTTLDQGSIASLVLNIILFTQKSQEHCCSFPAKLGGMLINKSD